MFAEVGKDSFLEEKNSIPGEEGSFLGVEDSFLDSHGFLHPGGSQDSQGLLEEGILQVVHHLHIHHHDPLHLHDHLQDQELLPLDPPYSQCLLHHVLHHDFHRYLHLPLVPKHQQLVP